MASMAALSVAGPAQALTLAEDRKSALARALKELRLPHTPAQLDLVGYKENSNRDGVRLEAVIRLTWKPGLRVRKFAFEAETFELAHLDIVTAAHDAFSNPR